MLLVEAGPDPRPLPDVVADPARQAELIRRSEFVRSYEVERGDGSTFPLLSGRIMGGGSSVNNLSVLRPMRRDFDVWAGFGGDAWSYEALLPLMRAIETDPDFPPGGLHGGDGPVRLHRAFKLGGPADPPVRALIDAATGIGLPLCPDVNVPEPFGVCASPYNIVEGRRQSAAAAWIDPARDRPNLTIRPMTTVTRLLLDGSRACGVEVEGSSGAERIEADLVVLSAGVYHSPHLLMLSGIGPPDELGRFGIRVRLPLTGVGANLQDHAVVDLELDGGPALRAEHDIPKVRLIAKSDDSLDHPDLHVLMRRQVSGRGRRPTLPVSVHLLEHRSTGRVSLATADPHDLPTVDPALLRHPDDVRALVGGIALVERLAQHPALAPFYGRMSSPASRDEWEQHICGTYGSYHHGVGTCRLGPAHDPDAVVDARLRVHGLDRLLVADASVLPTVPHANTNLAAMLVGAIAARELAA